jgi:subtilisin family serine protease
MIPTNILNCTNNTSFQSSWVVSGLNFSLILGARVTCSSFSLGFDSAIADAYSDTKVLGKILHFGSSGNSAPSSIGFPASDDDVVAVGNIQPDGTIRPSSQTGTVLDLVAPGTNVITTDLTGAAGYFNGSDYAMVNGTSFAAPYAAGVAALVLSENPGLTPNEVTLILKQSAVDLGAPCEDPIFGAGLVNAHRALLLAQDFIKGSVRAFNGSGFHPWYSTVADAVNGAGNGQVVLVHEGSFAEALTIKKPLLLRWWTASESSCGSAVVGE